MIKKIYTILTFCLACLALVSCIDDDLLVCDDVPRELTKGYSLNVTVTLDNFGGNALTRGSGGSDPLEFFDNYIDPEKFRVLFFDNEDYFLFESKSRWIKQLGPVAAASGEQLSQWLVSVPMYAYGNDIEEKWDWENIRKALMSADFKIAILANRPSWEYCPQFDEGNGIPEHWFDNSYPHWTNVNSKWGDDPKKVYDLHHCQPDPVYQGKSTGNGYYDFIQGEEIEYVDTDGNKHTYPSMGSSSSWVAWNVVGGTEQQVCPRDYASDFPSKGTSNDQARYTILPDERNPIPMYGIQTFKQIDKWIEGTPFNLSELTQGQEGYEYAHISLLRSTVKLELKIPKSYPRPKFVAMWYSNIYARCEPLNVWDNTKDIWKDHNSGCEWEDIMGYGLICDASNNAKAERKTNSKDAYQKTLSWFYKVWDEKGFWKGKLKGDWNSYTNLQTLNIFNPFIQRNKMVMCNIKGDVSDLYKDGYWHFVVYTGERNMIDPNTLPNMPGNAYAVNWTFKDERSGNYYCFPIADYNNDEYIDDLMSYVGPYKASEFLSTTGSTPGIVLPGKMAKYGNDLRDGTSKSVPWPLLRNHVYTITVGGPTELKWETIFESDSETEKNLEADGVNWEKTENKKNSNDWAFKNTEYKMFQIKTAQDNYKDKQLKAGANHDIVIPETAQMLFTPTQDNAINFEKVYKKDYEDSNETLKYYLRLEKGTKISFPDMENGQIITIRCKFPVTGGKPAADKDIRWIKPVDPAATNWECIGTTKQPTPGADKEYYVYFKDNQYYEEEYEFKWKLNTSSTTPVKVEFEVNPTGGIAILGACINDAIDGNARTTRGTENGIGFKIKAQDFHSKSIKFE